MDVFASYGRNVKVSRDNLRSVTRYRNIDDIIQQSDLHLDLYPSI